jgi:NADPH:quinone reductase-like Zn-dependent oxidoreductase
VPGDCDVILDAKLERLGALGAEHLINYKTHANWGEQAFELTGNAGVDLVVEVGGPGNLPQSINALAVDGCISLIGVLTAGPVKSHGCADDQEWPLEWHYRGFSGRSRQYDRGGGGE